MNESDLLPIAIGLGLLIAGSIQAVFWLASEMEKHDEGGKKRDH